MRIFIDIQSTDGRNDILVDRHLIDAEFQKAWMPFFRRDGCKEVTTEDCLQFVGDLMEQTEVIAFLLITGEDLHHVARRKKVLCWEVGWLDMG